MTEYAQPNAELLQDLVQTKMPFGKYKGATLCDLPISYLEWFHREGFPAGKLGMQLRTLYEIKLNGLTYLLEPLKKMAYSKALTYQVIYTVSGRQNFILSTISC